MVCSKISKLLLVLAFMFLVPGLACAQTTTVTGTAVQDANGNLYSNGTVSAFIVLNSGQALPAGALQSSGPFPTTGAGSFSIVLFSPATYQISICGTPVNIGPRANATPNSICFTSPPIAVSGGTLDVTASLGPIPLLGPKSGAAGGTPGGLTTQTQVNNNGVFGGTSCQTYPSIAIGPVNVDCDWHAKGPSPWADVTRYGVRAIVPNIAPATAVLTASINSGSSVATVSTASCIGQASSVCFVNGDGVMIRGAGATNTMTTPSVPTVTPSVAGSGTGTGIIVTGPTGATTYNYQVVARRLGGAITAASTVGSTSTGAASLGSQNVTITSSSRSNQTVTVVTASAHGLVVGSVVFLIGTSDVTFGGWQIVSTASDNTHFTYNSGMDTRNGASATSTGGTVYWWNCNRVVWSAVAGAFQYYIYGRTGGSLTIIGVSKPTNASNGSFTDGTLYWDDFGSPMMDNLTMVPDNIPSSPPVSATNDNLVTTIVSGAGTTTLTLANSATNSVSGATIRFDDEPNIAAAASTVGVSALYFPTTSVANGSYVINSPLNLFSFSQLALAGGNVTIFDTVLFNNPKWQGNPIPQSGTGTQFQFESLPNVTCNATPCIFIENGATGRIEGLQFTAGGSNNALLVLQDGGGGNPGVTYDRVQFQTGGASDYMGMALLNRGAAGSASGGAQLRKALFVGGPNQVNGATATPLWYCNDCGNVTIDSIFMQRRGIQFKTDPSSGFIFIGWGYTQGGVMPFVTASPSAGGVVGTVVDLNNITMDTMAHPIAANLSASGTSISGSLRLNNTGAASSGQNTIGGTVWPSVYATAAQATQGQNVNLINGQNFTSNTVSISGSGVIGSTLPIPGAPGLALSAGGSLSVASHNYQVQWFDVNGVLVGITGGNQTLLGPIASITTTSGNQTVVVTRPTPPAGAANWFVYRDGVPINTTNCFNGVPATTLTFTDAGTFVCGNPQTGPPATTAGINSTGLYGPQVQLINAGAINNWLGPTLFTNLGTPANGTFLYCPDCTIANPCAGGGAGAMAKRLNGVWVCN